MDLQDRLADTLYQGLSVQRHLLAVNCTPRSMDQFPSGIFSDEERKQGYILIHVVTVIYMFALTAIVCHEFFVPSLERITKVLGMESNVAGATIMAAGGSMPQLATSLIGVFVVKSDIGVGAVVGSSFFNVLFVLGMCGLFAGQVVYLHWWPMLRDCTMYVISAMVLTLVMMDERVHWYEAAVMILAYALYLVALFFNQALYNAASRALGVIQPCLATCCCGARLCCCNGDTEDETKTLVMQGDDKDGKDKSYQTHGEATPDVIQETSLDSGLPSSEKPQSSQETNIDAEADNKGPSEAPTVKEEEEFRSVLSFPSSAWKRVVWVLLLPAILIAAFTVPDCRRPGCWQKIYPLTFIMSMLWIGISSYVLVWMLTIIGDTAGVPDTVMGLTVLAAGSSLPDLLNAVFVSRHGYGDMAMSNCIGSNIFDMLFCLGLPWLLSVTVANPSREVIIYENLTYIVVCLLTSAFVVYFSTLLNSWKLDKKLGCVLVFAYFVYITFDALYDVKIAAPTCEQ